MNVPDLFLRWLSNGCSPADPTTYTTTFASVMDDLVARNIRFVRFLVIGFRTKTYRFGFKENRTLFFTKLDALVAAAESRGVLLVPSLFFSSPCLPPHFSEPLNAYGNTASQTYQEMSLVISEIVSRYKNSSAIAYWEFSNETDARTSNPVSSPNFSFDVNMEQPNGWTSADGWNDLTSSVATQRFHDLCKTYDPDGVTASGNQGWRVLGHNRRNSIMDILRDITLDDKTDTATIHPYESQGFHTTAYEGMAAYLRQLRSHLEAANKPLIVGEFGCSLTFSAGGRTGVQCYKFILDNIMSAEVDLAMSWAISAYPENDANWYHNVPAGAQVLAALTAAARKYRI